jgi:DNA-binding transcriptional MerR regulator
MKILDINQVSNRTGVPASTLRYYEEQGLISSVGRRGLRRLFGPEIVQQLALISLGKRAGFSLQEISAMFGPDGQPSIPRPALHEKADELDRQIKRMAALRDAIRHVAECPAPSHLECPTFRRLMEIGSKRQTAMPAGKPKPGKRRAQTDQ